MKIDIVGHTDNTGSDAVNWPLSERRARAVKDWLANQSPENYPDERVNTSGRGSSDPVSGYDPSSYEGRAKNRRVEIIMGMN
jgi:OOP family OmpA-OmpF porin